MILRRRYPRAPFTRPIGVLESGQYFLTEASTLGEGGCSFFYHKALQAGSLVVLTIPGLNRKPMIVLAVVRNSLKIDGRSLVGVEFQDLTREYRTWIRTYVIAKMKVFARQNVGAKKVEEGATASIHESKQVPSGLFELKESGASKNGGNQFQPADLSSLRVKP